MSTLWNSHRAHQAIDGDIRTCAMTGYETSPWWKAIFHKDILVNGTIITGLYILCGPRKLPKRALTRTHRGCYVHKYTLECPVSKEGAIVQSEKRLYTCTLLVTLFKYPTLTPGTTQPCRLTYCVMQLLFNYMQDQKGNEFFYAYIF